MSYPSTDRSCNKSSCRSDPADTANDTLSNYTSGKAVTVSWYQLRIISRSVYRLSTIYSRYTTNRKGAGALGEIVTISFHANRVSPYFSITNSHFNFIYLHPIPFSKKKRKKRKGWDRENLFQRYIRQFDDPLKKNDTRCPTFLLSDNYRSQVSDVEE